MVTASWFVTALEARNNIVKDIAVHREICGIEMQVLYAVQRGDYEVTVSDGTPMTESSATVSHVFSVNSATNVLNVPNHGYETGDIVTVSSTGQLPPPLVAGAYYYVIYLDQDNIKLATSRANALAGAAVSIDIDQGVTQVEVTNSGSGYLSVPAVSFVGGLPDEPASARAVLNRAGSVYNVSLLTPSSGFTSTPTAVVSPPGAGAVAGTVSFKVITATVAFGGSNYNVNDLLFTLTGTGTPAAFRVTAVSGGSVTAVSIVSAGSYTVLPTLSGSITNTSGFGGGATVNLTMGIAGIAVASGGLNYVNPPLVTISGGGGSGAQAAANLIGGVVSGFTMINAGNNYTDPLSLSVSISAGDSAVAVVQLEPTSVFGVDLTNPGGNDYLDPPLITFSTPGAGATAGSVLMKTVQATLRNAGVGYSQGDQLLVSGGTGIENTVIQVLTVNNQGSVITFNIIASGLYSVLPSLLSNNVYGGTGNGASFDLVIGVASIAVQTGGSGYTVPPLVLFAGNQPQMSATAISSLSGSSVNSITVVDPGRGYTSVPSVSLTCGSGASAQATLVPSGVDQIALFTGGSGYTVSPVVVISGGGGTGATAVATLVGDTVDQITLTDPGSGYTSNPSIQILGDGIGATAGIARFLTPIASIDMVEGGSNYVVTPTVSFSGGGSAAANSIMNSTGILAVRVTNPGQNYTADPLLLFTDGPNQDDPPVYPVTKVNRQFSVSTVQMLDSGSNYQSVPSVVFSAPQAVGGTLAQGTASLGVGTGIFSIRGYTSSLDYYKVLTCGTSGSNGTSNSLVDRPYADQMSAVIKYFSDLGYTITREVNPLTGNTFVWVIKW